MTEKNGSDQKCGPCEDNAPEMLKAAGWELGDDGFWSHPQVADGSLVDESIALYIESLTSGLRKPGALLRRLSSEIERFASSIDDLFLPL